MKRRPLSSTQKRNQHISAAYKAARVGNLSAARVYLRQAAACAPLTEFQLFRLRQFFGPETLEQLTGTDGSELLIRELARRHGGKP